MRLKEKKNRLILVALLLLLVLSFFVYNKPKKMWDSMESSSETIWSNVDVVYYINLAHREDRRSQLLDEMRKVGIPEDKVVRIDAVAEPKRGDLGCSKSHVKTMEQFLASPHHNCIVFEDDFEWLRTPDEVMQAFREFFYDHDLDNFDVLMLSANEVQTDATDKSWLRRVIDVQTTSGYMVNRPFADTLLKNFREGAHLLEQKYDEGKHEAYLYAVDQYWKRLQPEAAWYIFYPKLGKQRTSHSDIQGGVISMDV